GSTRAGSRTSRASWGAWRSCSSRPSSPRRSPETHEGRPRAAFALKKLGGPIPPSTRRRLRPEPQPALLPTTPPHTCKKYFAALFFAFFFVSFFFVAFFFAGIFSLTSFGSRSGTVAGTYAREYRNH